MPVHYMHAIMHVYTTSYLLYVFKLAIRHYHCYLYDEIALYFEPCAAERQVESA